MHLKICFFSSCENRDTSNRDAHIYAYVKFLLNYQLCSALWSIEWFVLRCVLHSNRRWFFWSLVFILQALSGQSFDSFSTEVVKCLAEPYLIGSSMNKTPNKRQLEPLQGTEQLQLSDGTPLKDSADSLY